MAPPVSIHHAPPKDPREGLNRSIQDAPAEHAEALLSAYDLLQRLHDAGVLDVLRGALGARDVLLDHAASLASAPQSLNAMRNLILIWKVLGGIDPAAPRAIYEARTAPANGSNPPSWIALVKRFAAADARRGLAVLVEVLEALGRGPARGTEGK